MVVEDCVGTSHEPEHPAWRVVADLRRLEENLLAWDFQLCTGLAPKVRGEPPSMHRGMSQLKLTWTLTTVVWFEVEQEYLHHSGLGPSGVILDAIL